MTAFPPPSSEQPSAYPPPPPPAHSLATPASYPPPPPPVGAPPAFPPPVPGTQPVQAPAVAWLVPVAALIAVIGAFTPWFDPTAERNGVNLLKGGGALYSWKDGRIGLAAPILLVILAISVIGLLRGKVSRRFSGSQNPVRSVGKVTIGLGVVALVCVVIAWFLVPGQYHFITTDGTSFSWHDLQRHGLKMGRGPQIGFYLTIVAGVLAIVGGIAMLATAKDQRTGPSLQK